MPVLGGLLAGALGWRVSFAMGALAALIGVAAILLFTRATTAARAVAFEERATTPPPWADLRLGGAILLASYIATFVVFFGRNGLLNAVVPVMGTDLLAFEPLHIGLLFSTMNAIGIGAVLLGGRLADRYGRARSLAPALGLLLLSQVAWLGVQDQLSYIVVGLLQGVAFSCIRSRQP